MFLRKVGDQGPHKGHTKPKAMKPSKDANMPVAAGLNQEQIFKKKNMFKEREKMKKLMDDNDYNRNQVLLHQKANNIHAEMQRITSYLDKEHALR